MMNTDFLNMREQREQRTDFLDTNCTNEHGFLPQITQMKTELEQKGTPAVAKAMAGREGTEAGGRGLCAGTSVSSAVSCKNIRGSASLNSLRDVIVRVAEYYRMKPRDLIQHRRFEPLATARGLVMVVGRCCGFSYQSIAYALSLASANSCFLTVRSFKKRMSMEAESVVYADYLAIISGEVFKADRVTMADVFAARRARAKKRKLDWNRSYQPRRRVLARGNRRDCVTVQPVVEEVSSVPGWGSLLFLEQQLKEVRSGHDVGGKG